jgi:hypothetical protein
LREDDQEAVQLLERYTQTLDRKELLKARKTHRSAGNQASNEMSLVSRYHAQSEPLLLTAWAKSLASSAVWEATAKKPTRAANLHFSAARAVGSVQRARTTDDREGTGSYNEHTIDWHLVSEEELAVQAALLRDIFANPFRPVVITPAWFTPTVLKLAQAAYDNRVLPAGLLDYTRLAVLADALEEAGSTDAEVLDHLRSAGPHYCGCWPVDLILGKS